MTIVDKRLDKTQQPDDALVRNEELDASHDEPQQQSPEEIEQEREDIDRFQATDN